MVRIIVVGAGVMAVSTAYLMKRQRPDYEVTIVAEKFTPNTTSDGAAGLWKFEESHPGQVYGMRDTPRDLLRYVLMVQLYNTSHPMQSCYQIPSSRISKYQAGRIFASRIFKINNKMEFHGSQRHLGPSCETEINS